MLESLLFSRSSSSSFVGHGYTVPYRYYRMNISARNLPASIVVGEWELLDTAGVNRALGKPASASDQTAGAAAGAFDGNVPTTLRNPHWQTDQTGNQWLSVDLGESMIIAKFALYADISAGTSYADYAPNSWKFEGSNDNSTWETITTVKGYTAAIWKSRRQHVWDVELTDKFFDNVSLLLNVDNFILDTSNRQKAVTPVGALGYVASTDKYGSAINFGNDQNAYNRLDIAAHPDLAFGTGDFTIELDLYLKQYSGQWGTYIYDGRDTPGTSLAPYIAVGRDGKIYTGVAQNSGGVANSSVIVPLNVWSKIGVQRKNGVLEIYFNNKLVGTAANNLNLVCNNPVRISQAYQGATSTTICGLVDNVRVTKALARLGNNYPYLNRSFPCH